MSDKKVGRSPQPQEPERGAGHDIHNSAADQAGFPDVPEAVHGDKTELLNRFKEREERLREQKPTSDRSGPTERD